MQAARLLAFSAAAALAACSQSPAENTAEQLENAAEQSDPAAAAVLENRAEQVLEQNSTAPAKGAMEAAGNAQVGSGNSAPTAPEAQQAKPHAPGDPVPPPQVKTGG